MMLWKKKKVFSERKYEKLLYQINPHFSAQYVKFRSVDGKNEPSGQYYGICTALKKDCCRIILEKKECRQHFEQKSIL